MTGSAERPSPARALKLTFGSHINYQVLLKLRDIKFSPRRGAGGEREREKKRFVGESYKRRSLCARRKLCNKTCRTVVLTEKYIDILTENKLTGIN